MNVHVGDIAQQLRGVSYSKGEAHSNPREDHIPILRANNITEDGLRFDDLVYVPRRRVAERQFLKPGDLVIAASSGSLDVVGKAAEVQDPFDGAFGAFCKVLRPDPQAVDPRYFANYFRTSSYRRTISALAAGANINNLKNEHLDTLEIPLPPLDEQRRIAAILDKADTLRRKRKRTLELLAGLTQSVFLEMFGDALSEPDGSNSVCPLSELAEIGSGITKGRKLRGPVTRNVPYLAVLNVQDRELDLSTVKTIEATEEEIERYRLIPGDLVVTEGGDPDKLGRGTIWNGELTEAIHQNHIFRVRVANNALHPIYLNYLVGSRYGKAYFLRSAKQTTGIASINKTQLSNFPVLVPSIDRQKEFAHRVEKTRGLIDCARSAGGAMERMFASLQSSAFARELR